MFDLQRITQETRAQVAKMILETQSNPELQKTINVATGLIGIPLDAPAQQLVSLLAQFRQSIPRRTVAGGNANTYRQITALSTPKFTVAENAASALFTTTVVTRTAAYKGTGLRGQVSREAQAASQGFDDALAKETGNTLLLSMKMEEQYILGGNITALATPAAPTLTERGGVGGLLAADEYFVRIAAMTLPAANRVSLDRPDDYDGTDGFLDIGRAIASVDVETDGVTVAGAETSVTTTGGGDALKVTWTAIPGAGAYIVYVGLTTGAANLTAEAIVTQTSVTFKDLATGGEAASALTGTSADALAYDGIIPHCFAGGSGAYLKDLNDEMTGALGEVTAVQDAFQSIWDNAKIGKLRLLASGLDTRLLTRLGVSQDSINIITNPLATDGRTQVVLGSHVGQIMNAITGDMVPVETLPWMPGGMLIILPTEIPYNDANVSDPFEMVMGFDWERWDYASTTTTGPIFPFETRSWGALQANFTGGCGIIHNIFKG